MALTAKMKTDINKMNRAAQNASLGTLVGNLEGGVAGVVVKKTQTVTRAQFTDGLAAVGTFTATGLNIPVGATVLASAITAITGFIGDTSATITIGDGSDVDRYNTGTPSVFTTAAAGIATGVASGTKYHAAAIDPVLTVTSAADFTNVSAGSVTVVMYYIL